ncbi:hypothetical protein TGVAND_289890 [Toxoplasma gondii VAND]|uniref:Uncharacterized protein n=4 Tax=Toxoplasma gondii TaxID=5811 RepID=V4ZF80_TOXGV|nr:hypothetical protein TGVEG_289890 [Toxoplasma gondii VEG]KFG33368.1 hypothetical protein TGP89_289890 [Toxoplasma gondii p89]KFH09056.1 hypothetical protein TGVAND_289890 [Toxoplasma gondii VAND]
MHGPLLSACVFKVPPTTLAVSKYSLLVLYTVSSQLQISLFSLFLPHHILTQRAKSYRSCFLWSAMDSSPASSADRRKRLPDSPGSSPSQSSRLFFRETEEPTSPPPQDQNENEEVDRQTLRATDASPTGDEESARRRWSDDDADAVEDPLASEQTAAAVKPTQRRQPPMNLDTFYMPGDSGEKGGVEKDGFFDLYCRLNFLRTQERKFGTINHGFHRKKQIAELEREVCELRNVVAEKRRRSEGSEPRANTEVTPEEPSLRALAVQLELKSKRLACLKARRCRDLRLDLNLLLKSMGDQLSDLYPYNESLDRMAQRLDQFSWKAPTWIGYRPLLLQKHKAGVYKQWIDAGCPEPPHSVLQKIAHQTHVEENMDDLYGDTTFSGSPQTENAKANSSSPFEEPEGHSPADAGKVRQDENKQPEAPHRKEESRTTQEPARSVSSDLTEDALRVMEEKKRAAIAKREALLREKRRLAEKEKALVF